MPRLDKINVANEELRTTREAAREIGAMLTQLSEGQLEKIVLTSRGQMVGVLLSVDEFAKYQTARNQMDPSSIDPDYGP
jgi:PHD/YefM family antitoxin component YafN of YafNO toxin-antitoxin module